MKADMISESAVVQADLETTRQKWAEFTAALTIGPGPASAASAPCSRWYRPDREADAERIVLEGLGERQTRVTFSLAYDEDEFEEGETFDDVTKYVHEDLILFKDYAEGRPQGDRRDRKTS